MKVAVGLFLASVGLWLLSDGLTFGLAPFDPTTGRAKRCYTWLDDAVWTRQPSDGLRQTQVVAGGTLAFGLPVVLAGRAMRRTLKRRS